MDNTKAMIAKQVRDLLLNNDISFYDNGQRHQFTAEVQVISDLQTLIRVPSSFLLCPRRFIIQVKEQY